MNLKNIKKNAMPTVARAAGAIIGTKVQGMIPFGSDKVKAGVTAIAGMLLAGSGKGLVSQVGEGVAIGGVLGLAKGFGIAGGDFIGGIGDITDSRWINGLSELNAGGSINGDDSPFNFNNSYSG